MKLHRYLLPIIMFLTQNCLSQELNVDSLFLEFKKNIQIEQQENAGVIRFDDETRITYYQLLNYSKIENLFSYTNDTNAAIRSYIFAGLVQKNVDSSIIKNILIKHINDTSKFSVMITDVKISWKVNEYMQNRVKTKAENKQKDIDFIKEIDRIKSKIQININGVSHGMIDKEALLKLDSLVCTDEKIKIFSFTLIIGNKSFKSANNILTKKNEKLY
ncbi:MAG: hypothetical protein IPO21_19950 [Bacteroidales bacterium]|nr:hypothetical protein [Bacteroidales bacterium]